jgi:transposase
MDWYLCTTIGPRPELAELHGKSSPDVEPTNNASERALRSAVIARKLSLGVQSEWGGQLVARLLSVTTSLEQQGRAAMDFLIELMVAHREGRPLPSLIPLTG